MFNDAEDAAIRASISVGQLRKWKTNGYKAGEKFLVKQGPLDLWGEDGPNYWRVIHPNGLVEEFRYTVIYERTELM